MPNMSSLLWVIVGVLAIVCMLVFLGVISVN